jgi:DNA-binding NarL/FixJ family response regulator
MIRIVIIDDQQLIRAGLHTLAEHDGDIAVLGDAGDGARGLEIVRRHVPDVVLMDLRMPVMDGIAATRAIVTDPALAAVRVLALTTFDDQRTILSAVRAGAAGYILKDISPVDLRQAIRTVHTGEALLSPTIARTLMDTLAATTADPVRAQLLDHLTPRERDVLRLIALGDSNSEIGRRLHISPDTARTYVSRLLAKLNARDRTHLVILGYETGLITPGHASR